MANDIIIPPNFGKVSSIFTPDMLDEADEFAAGITGGFGILGFRGKVWRTKFRGEETPHLNDDGTARGSVELVLVKSAPNKSKIYYPNGYEEGSSESPACFSSNGIMPDPSAADPQCATCAMCPHDQFGSRITESGKKGKACSDSKRVVVVPLGDIANEVYGGPMLLRVPAASLQDLAAYSNKMKGLGYPLFLIGTRIRFDLDAAYPKLIFSAIRPLTDDEAVQVRALRDDPQVARILNTMDEAGEPVTQESAFEQPAAPAAKQAPKPAAAKPAVSPQPPVRPATSAAKPAGRVGGIAAAVAQPQQAKPVVRQAPPAEPAPEPEVEMAGSEPGGELPAGFQSELDAQLEGLL